MEFILDLGMLANTHWMHHNPIHHILIVHFRRNS